MEDAKKPKVIAFVNQKGGVLKTTLTAQLAYGLAKFHNQKVLAIDLDPQANLTMAMGYHGKLGPEDTAYGILEMRRVPYVVGVQPNLSLIGSTIDLAKAEMGFLSRPDYQFLLKAALETLEDSDEISPFDYILIDSPPNLGLLTMNALIAADEVIIPLTCDGYAMNGVAALTQTISLVQRMNPGLIIGGIVPSRFDARRNVDKETLAKMKEVFQDMVYAHRVPESTALKECGPLGKSIWDYDSRTLAASALSEVVAEFLERASHDDT